MLTSEDILNLKEPPNELLEIHLYQVLEDTVTHVTLILNIYYI